MALFATPPRPRAAVAAVGLAALLAIPAAVVTGQQGQGKILRIGTSGMMTTEVGKGKEKGALETLRAFIRDETGYANEILKQKDWQELAAKLAAGQLQLGVFQGYEFAWAKAKYPGLQPLALAINGPRYPVVYVITRRDNPAKDFAGLKGQSLTLPAESPPYLRLFVDHEARLSGQKTGDFFSKVVTNANAEDALDAVFDRKVQAAVADSPTLRAYQRRKPGRFKQFKQVARSRPLPPAVVAYYGSKVDAATRQRLSTGLLRASRSERGETLLTLFRLTGFEPPPADFSTVLAQTRKAYPPTTLSTE